jgi:hypothetical protein
MSTLKQQLVEQRLAFGEPAVDRREKLASLIPLALIALRVVLISGIILSTAGPRSGARLKSLIYGDQSFSGSGADALFGASDAGASFAFGAPGAGASSAAGALFAAFASGALFGASGAGASGTTGAVGF